MKYIKFLLILFISINTSIIADSKEIIINELNLGGKLIFIRHAYAPGSGDPNNFDIKDCTTQRNLNNAGKEQAQKIGNYFKENNIPVEKVYSSEWCRCKDTALVAFNNFEQKSFLNSFFSSKFSQNKNDQIKNLKEFIKNWKGKKNLVFVTHYVVISEILNYTPSSGEVVVADKTFKVIDTITIPY
jgi:broad specificity phosphatase PhoE